ncbi:alpha/beta hydrolase [Priestia aryabhattai]|uniref:alpha/beta hydrolase n=1 Tax=Priestia megaterium TaxID=1404 RepID=UPI0039B98810
MNLEALVFQNKRGQNLVGIMHHAQGEGPHPCLIVCHGFAGTKTGGSRRFIEFAQYAVERGISVFRFDFAGSGDSEGDLVDLTLDNELEDLEVAFSTIQGMDKVDSEQLGILGHCMGAVTAIRAASRNKHVYKTIAWAPFSDIDGAICRLIGEDAYSILLEGEEADFLYNNQLFQCGPSIVETSKGINMFKEIQQVNNPLLVIHGTEDATVPLSEVDTLMNSVKENPNYTYEVIEGAHHSFPYHKEELFEITTNWFINNKGGFQNENKRESFV